MVELTWILEYYFEQKFSWKCRHSKNRPLRNYAHSRINDVLANRILILEFNFFKFTQKYIVYSFRKPFSLDFDKNYGLWIELSKIGDCSWKDSLLNVANNLFYTQELGNIIKLLNLSN